MHSILTEMDQNKTWFINYSTAKSYKYTQTGIDKWTRQNKHSLTAKECD